MLIVLSPAKKLDFESENMRSGGSTPRFMKETQELVKKARTLKAADLQAMMSISENLADLNVARFKAFETPFTPTNARPALDAFQGDVYVGLDAQTLDDEGRVFADKYVRILSGLYGVLRPLDLMQAYRLEMGTRFQTEHGPNLYSFWGSKIAEALDHDLADHADKTVVNLASGEYFKAVPKKALKAQIITPIFRDIKDGKARVVSFLAKKARGMMTRYVIDEQITQPEALKDFSGGGYKFDASSSTVNEWVFSRLQP